MGAERGRSPSHRERTEETVTWFMKAMAWLLLGVILALGGTMWMWYGGLALGVPVVLVMFGGISFYKSYKAFIEVWRSRLSERVGIEVAADKDTCLPGDAVNVSVKVTGKEELDIEEGRVALVCVKREVDHFQELDGEYRTRQVTDEVAEADERILEKKTLLPGSDSAHEVALEVPFYAEPSKSGFLPNFEWKSRVTLVVRGAPDVIEELPLTVLSSSES
jgi:hypothetical protein